MIRIKLLEIKNIKNMSSYLKFAKYKSFVIICFLVCSAIISALLIRGDDAQSSKNHIVSHPTILLYIREGCFYCKLATELLQEKSLHYETIELSNNEELYAKLVNTTGQTTVPYIFIDGQFIGGYSDLQKLNEENKL